MSQATVEAGIVATIKLHADFDDTNCYLYDRRALGKGLARLVIVSYSTHRREPLTLQVDRRIWTFFVDVMVPWRGQLTELDTRVGTETQKVIDTLAKYPRLNGTANIQRTDLTLSAFPDVISEKRGTYRGRRHTLDVLEVYNPGRAE
jgi:hypothetical protein